MPGVDPHAQPQEAQTAASQVYNVPAPKLPETVNSSFMDYQPGVNCGIARFELEKINNPDDRIKKAVDVRTFIVDIETEKGVKQEIHDIEVRAHQDVLDLLAYETTTTRPVKFALTYNPRPTTLVRDDEKGSNGMIWNLPGTYIRPGMSGALIDAASTILADKLGLIPVNSESASLEFLAGAAFTTPRTSTELAHRRAIEVHPIRSEGILSVGEGLSSERITKFFTADEIFQMFKNGQIKDIRIIDAICRFAKEHPELEVFDQTRGFLDKIELKDYKLSDSIKARILSSEDVTNLLNKPSALPHGVNNLTLQEKRDQPNYLHVDYYKVTPIKNNGSKAESFIIGSVRTLDPKHADAFDCAGICKIDGENYVVIREAVRPAIKARDLSPHAIRGVFPSTNFEGIGGTRSESQTSSSDVGLIQKYINNNFGVQLREGSSPIKLNSGYTSVGFSPQKTTLFFYEADPEKNIEAWDPSVRLVKITDYNKLAAQGLIRNLSLSAALGIIEKSLDSKEQAVEINTDKLKLRQRYLELLDRGSQIHAWMTQDQGKIEVVNALRRDKRFRLLACLAENELGLVMALMKDKEEKSFFSPTLPLYPVMSHKIGTGVAVLHFAHDLMHYAIGDYIPANTGDAKNDSHFKAFLKMYHENEIIAGWYSDYILPSILGQDKSRALLGRDSLFDLATIYNLPENKTKEFYARMERDGVIPEELLRDQEKYNRVRNSIIKATLYAHVMFKSHARAVYDNWMAHPKTSENAARFSDRSFQTIIEQQKIFNASESQIESYPEGINPLRAEISRTITRDIQLPMLRLSYFAEIMQSNRDKEEICKQAFAKIDDLFQVYQRLVELRSQVNSIEASDENLNVFAELEKITSANGPIARFKEYLEYFEKNHLTDDAKTKAASRLVPFYKKLPFVPERDIQGVAELERESFRKANLGEPTTRMIFN